MTSPRCFRSGFKKEVEEAPSEGGLGRRLLAGFLGGKGKAPAPSEGGGDGEKGERSGGSRPKPSVLVPKARPKNQPKPKGSVGFFFLEYVKS